MIYKGTKKLGVQFDRPLNKTEKDFAREARTGMYAFVNLPRGRPTKGVRTEFNSTKKNEEERTVAKPPPKPKLAKKKQNRGGYKKNWDECPAMDAAVKSMLAGGSIKQAYKAARGVDERFGAPQSTVRSRFKTAKQKAELDVPHEYAANEEDSEEGGENEDGTSGGGMLDLDKFDRTKNVSMFSNRVPRKSLTTIEEQQFIQDVANARDNNNKGMPRKEIVNMIATMQGVDLKTADNHYNYLVTSGKLLQLKRGGRVVSAQVTTTNRTAITTAKLLRTFQSQDLGKSSNEKYYFPFLVSYILLGSHYISLGGTEETELHITRRCSRVREDQGLLHPQPR